MGNSIPRPSRRRQMPQYAPQKISKKIQKNHISDVLGRLPQASPRRQCFLRLLRQNRVHDYLLLEMEFLQRQEIPTSGANQRQERKLVATLRGTPTALARVRELFEDNHAIVVVEGNRREWFVPILSIVDKTLVRLNAIVLVKVIGPFKNVPGAVVGVLQNSTVSRGMMFKLEKVPKENFDDIGGLGTQIQEIKETVELPLTHPEYFEDLGITAPKGVILYGEPGTGKTLLAKAVAHSTSATFLRATGADLVQKAPGEGARLVRELFRVAKENAPCILFLDEVDAVGMKRSRTSSRGEQEVQRTLLELLNQLDGFGSRGDVKIILATNRVDSLDPALIRPGRIDRKIQLSLPDEKTRLKILQIHSAQMTLAPDVQLEKIIGKEMSGADCRAICMEAGLLALRVRRKAVCMDDFERATRNVFMTKKVNVIEEFYM